MEFEKLQKKYTNLAQTSRKTALVAFGAAAIGIIALVLSVSFWLGTKGTVKVLEEKIEKIENSAPVEVTNDFESSVQQIAKQIQEVTTDFESKAQQAAKQIQEKLKK